jgi:hypothetical protein
MKKNGKDYIIVPSKKYPKFGIVVNLNPKVSNIKDCIKEEWTDNDEYSLGGNLSSHIKKNLEGYRGEIRNMAHESGRPTSWALVCSHKFHRMYHMIPLEISDDGDNSQSLLCDFGKINAENLEEFVEGDDFLFGNMFLHFQMRIMYQLLIFCLSKKIDTLILFVDKDYMKIISIYDDIITHQRDVSSSNDKRKRVAISVNEHIVSEWGNSLEVALFEFKKSLWEEHSENMLVRNYLMLNPCNKLLI